MWLELWNTKWNQLTVYFNRNLVWLRKGYGFDFKYHTERYSNDLPILSLLLLFSLAWGCI